jgi:adenosylhomocysteinase
LPISPTSLRKTTSPLPYLPKELDEEVAALMVKGFGGVMTKLTDDQAKYINVKVTGPYKPESYKY